MHKTSTFSVGETHRELGKLLRRQESVQGGKEEDKGKEGDKGKEEDKDKGKGEGKGKDEGKGKGEGDGADREKLRT
ncbi:hypothetical protein POVWA2_041760 [Plasmodium ovale wallikeri]|uniref:Uncharacterized protein n=1 Tax=Plasmodium ovale wallikeri TaxID=864142 RepID=A0A1A8ZC42_PLAOA|nr:hypothetical protein POVWA2_041760 [Plasmodium ovale wallikeri]